MGSLTKMLKSTKPITRLAGYEKVIKYFSQNGLSTHEEEFQWFKIVGGAIGTIIALGEEDSKKGGNIIKIYLNSAFVLNKEIINRDGKHFTKDETLELLSRFAGKLNSDLSVFGIDSKQDFLDAWDLVDTW